MPKKKNSSKAGKPTSGGGGGHDLPSIREVLASDHGYGTYRGQSNSIATVGLDLPIRKKDNPAGSGPKRSTLEPKTSTSGDKNKYK